MKLLHSILAVWFYICTCIALPTRTIHYFRAPSSDKKVIIQMFEWNWDSIAAECKNFIGAAGYGYVQVSPPAEHVQGAEWSSSYAPVSYNITSKRGDRAQFQNMINACHDAGVKVLVDAIFNHMSGYDNGVGVAGTPYTHFDYPGYGYDDFHHCTMTANSIIVDYNNRLEVTTCQLDTLADLATETENVRSRLAAYANDLISMGIDGFRLDAAKHIAADDMSNILGRLSSSSIYITQEVSCSNGDTIQANDYVQNGNVQEFRYTTKLMVDFLYGAISGLKDLNSLGWAPSEQVNAFVTNHDTERTGNSLNHTSPDNTYITATVFSLSYPYGTPTILSSYEYSTISDGAPNNGSGTCSETGSASGYLCQHRWNAFTSMVGFHNAVGDEALSDWASPQGKQIAYGRGSRGFVAINNDDQDWNVTLTTSLPDGWYCDVLSGKDSTGNCAKWVNVTAGSFGTIVPARWATAYHV